MDDHNAKIVINHDNEEIFEYKRKLVPPDREKIFDYASHQCQWVLLNNLRCQSQVSGKLHYHNHSEHQEDQQYGPCDSESFLGSNTLFQSCIINILSFIR